MNNDYLLSKRILLVDDEQELLDMVVSILGEAGFCQIETAKTVKEALDLADSFQPELAILDVMLPDGDGFSLMEKLKGEYPVLFLTACGEDDDKFKGFGLGADGVYLTEIAPGIDLQTQVLDLMDFAPKMDGEPKLMDARLFTDELMGLAE